MLQAILPDKFGYRSEADQRQDNIVVCRMQMQQHAQMSSMFYSIAGIDIR